MRKKRLTRSVCVMLSEEMYRQIADITDDKEISISDYIREAIQQLMQTAICNEIAMEDDKHDK